MEELRGSHSDRHNHLWLGKIKRKGKKEERKVYYLLLAPRERKNHLTKTNSITEKKGSGSLQKNIEQNLL